MTSHLPPQSPPTPIGLRRPAAQPGLSGGRPTTSNAPESQSTKPPWPARAKLASGTATVVLPAPPEMSNTTAAGTGRFDLVVMSPQTKKPSGTPTNAQERTGPTAAFQTALQGCQAVSSRSQLVQGRVRRAFLVAECRGAGGLYRGGGGGRRYRSGAILGGERSCGPWEACGRHTFALKSPTCSTRARTRPERPAARRFQSRHSLRNAQERSGTLRNACAAVDARTFGCGCHNVGDTIYGVPQPDEY